MVANRLLKTFSLIVVLVLLINDSNASSLGNKIGGKLFGFDKRQANIKSAMDRIKLQNEDISQQTLDDQKVKDTKTVIDGQNFDNIELISSKTHATMWKNFMHDFVPEDVYQFIIGGSESLAFHFTIDSDFVLHVRGFYNTLEINQQTNDRNLNRINVIITDPNGEMLFMKRQQDTGILMIDSTVKGEYTVLFENIQKTDRHVIFNLHKDYTETKNPYVQYPDAYKTPNEINDEKNQIIREQMEISDDDQPYEEIDPEDEAINDYDVQSVKTALMQTQSVLKNIQFEAKQSYERQQTHNQDVQSNTSYNLYFMLIELVLFLLVLFAQVKYTQKILDQKGLMI